MGLSQLPEDILFVICDHIMFALVEYPSERLMNHLLFGSESSQPYYMTINKHDKVRERWLWDEYWTEIRCKGRVHISRLSRTCRRLYLCFRTVIYRDICLTSSMAPHLQTSQWPGWDPTPDCCRRAWERSNKSVVYSLTWTIAQHPELSTMIRSLDGSYACSSDLLSYCNDLRSAAFKREDLLAHVPNPRNLLMLKLCFDVSWRSDLLAPFTNLQVLSFEVHQSTSWHTEDDSENMTRIAQPFRTLPLRKLEILCDPLGHSFCDLSSTRLSVFISLIGPTMVEFSGNTGLQAERDGKPVPSIMNRNLSRLKILTLGPGSTMIDLSSLSKSIRELHLNNDQWLRWGSNTLLPSFSFLPPSLQQLHIHAEFRDPNLRLDSPRFLSLLKKLMKDAEVGDVASTSTPGRVQDVAVTNAFWDHSLERAEFLVFEIGPGAEAAAAPPPFLPFLNILEFHAANLTHIPTRDEERRYRECLVFTFQTSISMRSR